MNINLNLTVEQVNLILAILSEQPYARVVTLIDPIMSQGKPQAEALEKMQKEQQNGKQVDTEGNQ